MSKTNHGDSSIIFQGPDHAPKPLAPPAYRQRALRSVIKHRRSEGANSLSLSELVSELRDQNLRDDSDPRFEPLSFESIDAAVKDLEGSRELKVDGRSVIFCPAKK